MKNIFVDKGDIYISMLYLIATALTVTQTVILVWIAYEFNTRYDASFPNSASSSKTLERITAIEMQLEATNQMVRDIRDDIRSNHKNDKVI